MLRSLLLYSTLEDKRLLHRSVKLGQKVSIGYAEHFSINLLKYDLKKPSNENAFLEIDYGEKSLYLKIRGVPDGVVVLRRGKRITVEEFGLVFVNDTIYFFNVQINLSQSDVPVETPKPKPKLQPSPPLAKLDVGEAEEDKDFEDRVRYEVQRRLRNAQRRAIQERRSHDLLQSAHRSHFSKYRRETASSLSLGGLASKEFLEDAAPSSNEIAMPRRGWALFRVPRTMWIESAEIAELRLTREHDLTVALQAKIEKTMTGRGRRTETYPVEPLGLHMKAVVLSDGRFLQVEALSSELQEVTDRIMHWNWRIVPIKEGKTLITLQISMACEGDSYPVFADAQAIHEVINITVNSFFTRPKRFIRDHWKWGIGAGSLGGIIAFVGRYFGL